MGQTPLFETPRDRLGRRLHQDLCGPLPASLGRALDVPEVAAAVRPLLARGWRPAQLAARIGALPDVGSDPVPAVVAFLEALLERESPMQAHRRERAEQARWAKDHADRMPPPASDEARAHWVAEARRSLGLPPHRLPAPSAPPTRRCASCPGEGSFFVTRDVRLCGACVELLSSGRARLAVGA